MPCYAKIYEPSSQNTAGHESQNYKSQVTDLWNILTINLLNNSVQGLDFQVFENLADLCTNDSLICIWNISSLNVD
jgi:hypothetical protein